MDDTIEVCSGCGKMPRAMDNSTGQFVCSRCGNQLTMHVTAENYEKVVTELDLRFHASTQKQRIDSAASTPVEIKKKAHTARNKAVASAVKKPAPKKGAKKAKKR